MASEKGSTAARDLINYKTSQRLRQDPLTTTYGHGGFGNAGAGLGQTPYGLQSARLGGFRPESGYMGAGLLGDGPGFGVDDPTAPGYGLGGVGLSGTDTDMKLDGKPMYPGVQMAQSQYYGEDNRNLL